MTDLMSHLPIVNGETRLFAIIGDPIAQVRSPDIYNPRIAKTGHNAILIPIHVPAQNFDAAVAGLKALGNLDGLVVTVPFKERILPFADRVLARGQEVGAINALRRESDGSWTGDMFDGVGLLAGIESLSQTPSGRQVLLLGAGGAGRAIAFALGAAGAARIGISDIAIERAVQLADGVRAAYGECRVSAVAPEVAGYDLLINATPVGMAPDFAMPQLIGALHPGLTVIDIVPKPAETALLGAARAAGCAFTNGQAMIGGQADAVLSFFGISPPRGGERRAIL